jgi:uncharacterized protein YfaQ (DUF2300 family)
LTKGANSEDGRKENESKKAMVKKDEATTKAIRGGVNTAGRSFLPDKYGIETSS